MLVSRGLPSSPLVGAAALAGSALALEIALTRLFSVLYFPPYVFLIISIAILGIGMGAALGAWKPSLLAGSRLTTYCAGAAISALLLVLLVAADSASAIQLPLLGLLALPYLFFGLAIATIFSENPAASRLLYMSDLLGAGIGAMMAIPLLNSLGAINAVLAAALAFALAGALFMGGRKRYLALPVLLAALLLGNASADILRLDMAGISAEKPIVSALNNGGAILETRWDAFARTDLLQPAEPAPMRIYVDGGAASLMPGEAFAADLIRDIGFFPFATEQPEKVFILGPGAGLDVYFALRSQAKSITAVEVNAASVELVHALRAQNGAIYASPEVEVTVDDGRSALRRSGEKYDLIYLSQVVTLAAERGGYALSESPIYTAEAFSEYLAHLAEGGQIALKLYDEITLTRALSTALAALRSRDLSDQEGLRHLMAFVDERGNPPLPLLLIGAQPFDEDDSLVLGAIAREVGFKPLLLPALLVQAPLDDVMAGRRTFADIVAASDADISPATDDRPYFFQFERGLPTSLLPLIVIACLIVICLLALSLWHLRNSASRATRWHPPFFALLGAGFMAAEVYAIQLTRLFLGHPTLAVTLVLAVFLLGGGLGSGLSRSRPARILRKYPALATAAIVLLLIFWSAAWALLSPQLVGASLGLRAAFVALTLLPLALALGMPFPQALAFVGAVNLRQVALAWSVNGLMTVVGSAFSVALSIVIGFSAVLWLAAGAYLLATLILLFVHREALV